MATITFCKTYCSKSWLNNCQRKGRINEELHCYLVYLLLDTQLQLIRRGFKRLNLDGTNTVLSFSELEDYCKFKSACYFNVSTANN